MWLDLDEDGGGSVIPDSSGNVELDTTLTEEGKAADAKAVGDAIYQISEEIAPLKDNYNSNVKSGNELVFDCVEGYCINVDGEEDSDVTLICSGKNLLPTLANSGIVNGITYVLNDDGSIHVSGTATAAVYLYAPTTYFPAGNYVFRSNIQLVNGSPGGYICVVPETAQFDAFLLAQNRPIKRIQLTEGGMLFAYLYLSKDLAIDADIWWTAEREEIVDDGYLPDYTPCVTTVYNGKLPMQVVTNNGKNTIYTTNNARLIGTYYKIKTDQENDENTAVVTPEMYGAKCDGITDDSSAIQQAIDSGKVLSLNGEYTVKTTLIIPSGLNVVCGGSHKFLLHGAGKIVLQDDATLSNAVIYYYGNDTAVQIAGRKVTVSNCKLVGNGAGDGISFESENGIANSIVRECRIEYFACAVRMESTSWVNGGTVDIYTDACKQSCVIKGDGHCLRIRGQSATLLVNNNELPQIVIDGNYNRVEEALFDVGLVNNCALGFEVRGAFNTYEGALSSSRYAHNTAVGQCNQFTRPALSSAAVQTQVCYTKSNWNDIVTAERTTVNTELTTIDLTIAENIKNRIMLNNYSTPIYSLPGDTVGVVAFDVSLPRMSSFIYAAIELGCMHYPKSITIEFIPTTGDPIVLSNRNNDRIMYLIGDEDVRTLHRYDITTMRIIIELKGDTVDFIGASGLFY